MTLIQRLKFQKDFIDFVTKNKAENYSLDWINKDGNYIAKINVVFKNTTSKDGYTNQQTI